MEHVRQQYEWSMYNPDSMLYEQYWYHWRCLWNRWSESQLSRYQWLGYYVLVKFEHQPSQGILNFQRRILGTHLSTALNPNAYALPHNCCTTFLSWVFFSIYINGISCIDFFTKVDNSNNTFALSVKDIKNNESKIGKGWFFATNSRKYNQIDKTSNHEFCISFQM